MPGVHGLEQVVAAFVADFSHDNAVGTVTESCRHQLTRRDRNLAGDGGDCLPANGVGMSDLQFSRLLDDNESLVHRNMVKKGLH